VGEYGLTRAERELYSVVAAAAPDLTGRIHALLDKGKYEAVSGETINRIKAALFDAHGGRR